MRQAYLKYPDTDWRIAMFHHDIYGNGKYHSQDDYITMKLRPCLTELISKYKFDLVINGHDHVYSASYFISYEDSAKGYDPKEIVKEKVNENPNGTFYITGNCSSGSKLYGYVEKDFDYVYNYNQTYTSSFGTLDFEKEEDKVRLTINYYEVDTHRKIDGPYIIEKSEKNYNIIFLYIN
ncbi:hypothetical protein BCR32DRAFT_241644 [Anaeromyces robustus]|uniref:Calcineurin-like phosphoesterase domain-containing protein n=1 Tax=Anaeromyces robustus TaxID=1754192 RepID=A0A1Y1XII2_9FUNG|nr:hypothetical protein BCR32DRAFT_241644 [Anaeromyces robustus]|eukprot:ORX85578.1 hypothetical protein BCR32DRAFT_241644 [Anaeromyces robustus]